VTGPDGRPAVAPADVPDADDGAPRRRGRRPAGEDTRGAILEAARAEFAARGYDGATLRGIARAAGVDPRLVHHYFDGKEDVFVAALDIPARPQDIVPLIIGPGRDGLGERLATFFFAVWDTPQGRDRIVALLASALASPEAARILREFLTREVFGRVAAALGGDDADLRANLAASQMVGVAVARYVVGLEPLASATSDELVSWIGPTLQRYLTG
jgi:AcrR family transcriptional regulator